MKKFIYTLIFSLLISTSSFAQLIGLNSVNSYIAKGYTVQSTNINNDQIFYHLINKRADPKFITCIYVVDKQQAVCFKP